MIIMSNWWVPSDMAIIYGNHWQAKEDTGYAIDNFDIDWEGRTVTYTTRDWTPTHDAKKNPVIRVQFARSVCASCESRLLCTHAAKDGRSMTLRANQAQYQVLRDIR